MLIRMVNELFEHSSIGNLHPLLSHLPAATFQQHCAEWLMKALTYGEAHADCFSHVLQLCAHANARNVAMLTPSMLTFIDRLKPGTVDFLLRQQGVISAQLLPSPATMQSPMFQRMLSTLVDFD